MAIITPKQALSKIYRQMPIDAADFDRFVQALLSLFDRVEDGQKEEKQKEYLRSFLSSSFYKPYHMAPEGDIDLAIRLDKSSKSKIGVLIEVKSTTAKGEMISRDNLNRKALQELLLYYLRERITQKNHDIKHLVVSNVYEFFIFDAHEFERKFYSNNSLRHDYLDFVEGRKTSSKVVVK